MSVGSHSLVVAAPPAQQHEQGPLCAVAHQIYRPVILLYQESLQWIQWVQMDSMGSNGFDRFESCSQNQSCNAVWALKVESDMIARVHGYQHCGL